ncbi:ECF RNA polymerase sigma factor SigW [Planctomycetes bacterium Poly30]|uniref:ECF RNA polymerase sigma factor SigW n=1 Tax=Saltatorellus ferox TaxID=2528018 RepID=A0A518EXL3_9BACT|nr:ECF RNA polymerase sigma factor SigW [Planctomycetes bacterium Poly30]
MTPSVFPTRIDASFRRFQRKGDPRAISRVFDEAAPELLRVARGFARGDEALAEDAVQAAFLAAMEKSASFDGKRRVMPWLLGLLAVELRRERADRQRTPNPVWLREGAALRAPADPEATAADAELKELIARRVEQLPDTYREAVKEHLFSGAAPATIAKKLGITQGALHVRVHRGLGQLRSLLPAGTALGAGLMASEARGLASVRGVVLGSSAAGGAAVASAGVNSAAMGAASGGAMAGWPLSLAAATTIGLVGGGAAMAIWRQPTAPDAAIAGMAGPAPVVAMVPPPDPVELAPLPERRAALTIDEPPAPSDPPNTPMDAALTAVDWLDLYRNARGYTEIYALGRQLIALPGTEGLKIAREVYPLLDTAQRKQFAKPFVFHEGAPYGLDVVDVVANDPDPQVRVYGWAFLRPFAFRDFERDEPAYANWRASTAGLARREVLLGSALDLARRCGETSGADVVPLLTEAQPPTTRVLDAVKILPRELFGSTGFGVQLRRWLASSNEPLLLAALRWAPLVDLSESDLRTYVLPLLDHSNAALSTSAARALARSGHAFVAAELDLRFGDLAGPNEDEAHSLRYWIEWTETMD